MVGPQYIRYVSSIAHMAGPQHIKYIFSFRAQNFHQGGDGKRGKRKAPLKQIISTTASDVCRYGISTVYLKHFMYGHSLKYFMYGIKTGSLFVPRVGG